MKLLRAVVFDEFEERVARFAWRGTVEEREILAPAFAAFGQRVAVFPPFAPVKNMDMSQPGEDGGEGFATLVRRCAIGWLPER